MNIDQIMNHQPQYEECSTPEAPLRHILYCYYLEHFDQHEAEKWTDRYILELLAITENES